MVLFSVLTLVVWAGLCLIPPRSSPSLRHGAGAALPCGSIVAVIDGNLMHAQGLHASLLDKCPGFLIPICLVLCHPCENWGFICVAP